MLSEIIVEGDEFLHMSDHVKACQRRLAPVSAHDLRQFAIAQQTRYSSSEPGAVAGGNQEAGSVILNNLGQRSGGASNHGVASHHRLNGDQAEGLLPTGWNHLYPGPRKLPLHFRLRQMAQEANAGGKIQLSNESSQTLAFRTFPGDEQICVGKLPQYDRECEQQQIDAFS